jgi:hypothetical protein
VIVLIVVLNQLVKEKIKNFIVFSAMVFIVNYLYKRLLPKVIDIDTELSIDGIENISNGITLCKICHTAFDDGMDFYGLNQIFKLKQMKPREIYVWMKNLSQSIISIIWIYIMVVVSYVGLRIPVYIIYSLLNLFGIGERKGKDWAILTREEAMVKKLQNIQISTPYDGGTNKCSGKRNQECTNNKLCKSCCVEGGVQKVFHS